LSEKFPKITEGEENPDRFIVGIQQAVKSIPLISQDHLSISLN